MPRKLASIRVINSLTPIEGADRIECAHIGGWQVVVKKGEFQPNDLCVYFEIDSWVPNEVAPFLSRGKEPRVYKGVPGERLKTIKLKGQISQGLVIPLWELTEEQADFCQEYDFNDPTGCDLTELLNVQLWERELPAQLRGSAKGGFPYLIPKTDQERVQNLSLKQIEQYAKEQWEITEKVDGSSITMAIIDDEFIVCSRNINLKEDPNNSFWRAARKYRIEEKLRQIDAPIAIQGEIIGPGVQGNQYEREDVEFLCYDIWHMERQRYLTSYERMHITSQYEIPHVPLIMTAPLLSLDIKVLLSLADGQSLINRSPREGLVFKSLTNPMNHFKCVSNEWLLRYE